MMIGMKRAVVGLFAVASLGACAVVNPPHASAPLAPMADTGPVHRSRTDLCDSLAECVAQGHQPYASRQEQMRPKLPVQKGESPFRYQRGEPLL
jgi:hypothetical protein